MPREEKRYHIFISAAIFIALEVAALGMLSSSSTLQNIWINRASHRTIAALWSGHESIHNYFSLNRQNEELSSRNAELLQQLLKYEEKERLETSPDLRPTMSENFSYLPSTIVKMSRYNLHNYIILDKGSDDGVEVEDGIISSKGVVGIIDAVGKHFSYGQTLMNVNVKVSARIGRNGEVGTLSWDGINPDKAWVRNLPSHFKTAKDTVYTSGFSAVYPPDIPLGLTGVSKLSDGSTKDLEVNLFQDFSTLRYVTIVKNLMKKEISSLETEVENRSKKNKKR